MRARARSSAASSSRGRPPRSRPRAAPARCPPPSSRGRRRRRAQSLPCARTVVPRAAAKCARARQARTRRHARAELLQAHHCDGTRASQSRLSAMQVRSPFTRFRVLIRYADGPLPEPCNTKPGDTEPSVTSEHYVPLQPPLYLELKDLVDPHPDTISVTEARDACSMRRSPPRRSRATRATSAARPRLFRSPVLLPDLAAGAVRRDRAHGEPGPASFRSGSTAERGQTPAPAPRPARARPAAHAAPRSRQPPVALAPGTPHAPPRVGTPPHPR